MMDEAEKYQQRLQAIAEKRRLQEEEERAKRDMEDERLRLQQLKRKSLRDQWLMEGPPLSPTSSEGSQGPRSPGWGSHGQEIEKNIDKLQTETQRLAEEEEKLKEQMEDGQTEPIEETEVTTEAVQEAVVQNGQEETTGSDLAEDEMKTLSPLLDRPAAVITNGRGGEEEEEAEDEGNHVASEESPPPPPPTTNGLAAAPLEGTVTMTFLGYTEAESDRAPGEAAEEGTLVMRAERVIITDEGDEVTYDVTSQGEQGEEEEVGEGSEEEAAPRLQSSESTQEGGEEAVGELAEAVPHQASTEPENATEITEAASSSSAAEIDSLAADGEMGDSETHQNGAVEITTDGEEKSEAPASDSPPASADAPDGAAVASVPVYSESQPSPDGIAVRAEAEGEETTEEPTAQTGGEESDVAVQKDPMPEEEAEAGSTPHVPAAATVPEGQFQDVSLADPQESPIRTDAGEQPGEQEPLLSQTKAPEITRAELPAAAASSPPAAAAAAAASSYTETHIPARANQGGEEAAAPKSKTCQCCSVM